MSPPATEYLTDLEQKTYFHLDLIKRIDTILEGPVKTIISIVAEHTEQPAGDGEGRGRGFPVWMSEDVQPEPDDDLFSKSLCFAAIQEIDKIKRRFPWLKVEGKKLAELTRQAGGDHLTPLTRALLRGDGLRPAAPGAAPERTEHAPPPRQPPPEFLQLLDRLYSKSFGALNPLTSAQVFQVLINEGERQAHGSIGFLASFAMFWSLYRRFPDAQSAGAAIVPWEPKAYVTARCLLPIKSIQDICTERATMLEGIVEILTDLREQASGDHHDTGRDDRRDDPYERWVFCAQMEKLRAKLLRLLRLVMVRQKIKDCPEELRNIYGEMFHDFGRVAQPPRGDAGGDHILQQYFAKVLDIVDRTLHEIGSEGLKVLRGDAGGARGPDGLPDSTTLLDYVDEYIVKRLGDFHEHAKQTDGELSPSEVAYFKETLKLKFAGQYLHHQNREVRARYLGELHRAAEAGLSFCRGALKDLGDASEVCAKVEPAPGGQFTPRPFEQVAEAAEYLARANRKVARDFDGLVREATVWCRTVVDREIAHASARNDTDFDPSELVNGIAVAVKWNQMTTARQVSDAVSKALAGVRDDGSWIPGQPFYSPNNAMGIWPVTSDTVLSLTSVLDQHKDVPVADEALFRYVDWLELTRTELNFPPAPGGRAAAQRAVGWASDRLRHRRKIHFPTTVFSIQALLKIRDLIEYRLWQLCEKRFTVIPSGSDGGLHSVVPVDLGAKHKKRLHGTLAQMAEGQARGSSDAKYSLVLHGPPGSSKTAIAKAFSVEMWEALRPWGSTEPARLLRITPADFTRLGEDRLDSEARLIFNLIGGVRGVTIFFDEIDDLLRQRNTAPDPMAPKPTFMEIVVPAMLNRLQDLRDACERQQVCFMLATNFVDTIEPALIRKGRIDQAVPVVYPDNESRIALIASLTQKLEAALRKELRLKPEEASQWMLHFIRKFAKLLAGWPYLTIKSACVQVQEKLLSDVLKYRAEAAGREGEAGPVPNGGGPLPRVEILESFLPRVNQHILHVIKEHDYSFVKPDYTDRLGLTGERPADSRRRPELVDEYAHYIISILKSRDEWEKLTREVAGDESGGVKDNKKKGLMGKIREHIKEVDGLKARVDEIISAQERWQDNGNP